MASVRVDSPTAGKGLKHVIAVFLNSICVPICFKTDFDIMNDYIVNCIYIYIYNYDDCSG